MQGWTRIAVAAGLFPALAFAQDSGGASHDKTVGIPHTCEHFFPDDLRYDGAHGRTTIAFTVTAAGGVADITIAKSSGNAELDAAAITCATYWRYKPATRDKVPVATPWKAAIVWSVPRKDVANQVHRDFIPAAPSVPVGSKQ
jgi:TonB family protein